MADWVVIALLLLILWFWYSSLRAKEIANLGAKMRCDIQGVLFLDQSVALQRIRQRRGGDGRLLLQREYRFEFSATGDERSQGTITVLGGKVTAFSIDRPHSEPES
ncbi:MAG: DUF3301 domain-containing protein [Gammaproteobacteria bacterium]|nr:DUF3301 domain-containing protein [Gammaproteobacteria bacterium]